MASFVESAAGRAARRPVGSIAVIVPAHNEAELISRCLRSVVAATAELRHTCRNPPGIRPIVVLDDCTDATADVVAGFAGVRALTVNARRVGIARRVGAEFALRDASAAPEWLACTDADSVVPVHWLTAMVGFAQWGADLVLGTVRPDATVSETRLRRWRHRYRDIEGHPHVHGANLGIGARAYRMVGGWPDVRRGEDEILARRVTRAGLAVVRTSTITVETSGRLRGRAPDGFAAYLAALCR